MTVQTRPRHCGKNLVKMVQALLISKCKIVHVHGVVNSDLQPAPATWSCEKVWVVGSGGRVECVSPHPCTDEIQAPTALDRNPSTVSRAYVPFPPRLVFFFQVRKRTQGLNSYHIALWKMVSSV